MNSLRNIGAIFHKEWRHYFGSPIAYVFLTVGVFLFGRFFIVELAGFLRYTTMMAQQMEFGGGQKLSLNEYVIRPVLINSAVVALFLTPMITMRLFAEEKRQGTLELLSTSPLSDWEVILGKFLAATSLYGLVIVAGFVDVLTLWRYATPAPEWKPVLTGGFALLLLGASFISLGTFVSTLTRNQIVAAILSFCLFLFIWTLGWGNDPSVTGVWKLVAYLSVTTHMEDLMKGVLDLKDVVYYLSFVFFGLFLAHQSMESQRWRA